MDKVRHKRNYALHSWSGIVLGLFVFVVSLSGSFAVFHEELHTWEDPALRLPMAEDPVPMGNTFSAWLAAHDSETTQFDFIRFDFPTDVLPYYSAYVLLERELNDGSHEHETIEARWNPATGEPIPARGGGLSFWILRFHQDLMWPDALGGRTVGRGLVGVAGVILLLSIISGVVAHTKIFKTLFTLRFFRSTRLKWQDTHKVLGLWGLPFFTMIAVTGAIIGVVTLLAPIIALLTFKGDQEALVEAVLGQPAEAAGIEAEMLSVDALGAFDGPEDAGPVWFVTYTHYGDENALADIFYKPEAKLSISDSIQVSAVTGQVTGHGPHDAMTPANRVLGAMTPLHYGTYGGAALKMIYFLLGIALAVITALGMMMWIERRLHGNEGTQSAWVYRSLSRLTVGVTCGLGLATAAIFYADRLLTIAPEARTLAVGQSYFIVWASAIVYAFLRQDDYRAVRELLVTTGVLAAALPLLDVLTTGEAFLHNRTGLAAYAAWVNLAALIIGGVVIMVALSLPPKRAEKQERKSAVTFEPQSS